MIGRNRSVSKIESSPLQQGQDPLEAGAGVDVLVGQLGQAAIGRPVQLHEHQVPQFDEALLSAEFGSAIRRRRPAPCR